MQPLIRFAPRLFSDTSAFSAAPNRFHLTNRASLRRSTCLRCKIHSQQRFFADSLKPPSPTNEPNPEDLPPTREIPPHTSEAITKPRPSDNGHADLHLPSTAEGRRSAFNQRFSHLMDNMQGNIFIASQRINDLTGYSGIEALKARIVRLEQRVSDAQESVRSSRIHYKTTVADRASTQREVTTLLARKDSWTPIDLERFTSLYRMDHTNEQSVQEAATKLSDAEREAEVAAGKLSSAILSRYHEEQIWSDKIRRMSTWGTWGLMGVNVLLFLVFQFGFEPWRRRRLVRGFEEKVKEALEMEKQARESGVDLGGESLKEVLNEGAKELEEELTDDEKSDPVVDAVVACITNEVDNESASEVSFEEDHVPTAIMKLREPLTWKSSVIDLFSERPVTMRKQDLTKVALEGAATGATVVTIIAILLRS